MSSAEPSLSSVNESMSAIGLQPVLYLMSVTSLQLKNAELLYLANEFNFIPFYVFDRKNVQFC